MQHTMYQLLWQAGRRCNHLGGGGGGGGGAEVSLARLSKSVTNKIDLVH